MLDVITKLFVLTAFLFSAVVASALESPPSTLPAPTGKFGVGTRGLEPFVDPSRPDERFARGARTLAVQLWYPTDAKRGTRSLYFTVSKLVDVIKAESSDPALVESWRTLRTHAIEDAPLAKGQFPLILFSPGFGISRAYYTSWIEQLASNGFIVAAVDHPFAGLTVIGDRVFKEAPNPNGPGAKASEMAADLLFLLPALAALPGVDGSQIAAIGHSIGGTAALEACRLDKRLSACVNIDGDAFGMFASGIGRPFMLIHQQPVYPDSKPDGELAKMGRQIDATWHGIIAKQDAPVVRLSVRGTQHLSFSDAPFLRPRLVTEGGGILTDPILVLRGTTAVITDYLRNAFAGEPRLTSPTPPFIGPAQLGIVK